MKILLYQWKVYHQPDILAALERMGHIVDTDRLSGENYNENPPFTAEVAGRIRAEHYDLILTVNYFGAISDACMQSGIPYAVWTCDSPLISMYHRTVYNACNYLFIFDQVQYYYFKSLGLQHVYYLPLAVDAVRLEQLTGMRENPKIRESEIAFVGSLYEKNAYDEIACKLTPYLSGYFDAAMNAQADIFGENIFDRMLTTDILAELSEMIDFTQSADSFSDLALVFSTTFLGFKMAQRERIGCLSVLGQRHRVDLYSDSKLFQDDITEAAGVHNLGSVEYMTDMPLVFHRSKVNLNFTIRNIRSGIPLRVWDVLGAGGFLLTNFQAELPAYFENGKHLVWFDSVEDMRRKADYYLTHEEERIAIAENGHKLVKQHHTYEERLRLILQSVKGGQE